MTPLPLDTARAHGDDAGRSESYDAALQHVTEMFLAGIELYSDAQIDEFDASLARLVDRVETPARADLSRQFADLARAPAGIVRRLARDEHIDVAGPVLSRSPQLGSADLVALARSRGQDHLRAIGSRATLDASVTDVLLDRGDDSVAHTVAANGGASFSFRGFASLIRRAGSDDDLAETVGTRSDLPPAVLRAVVSYVSEEARRRISAGVAPELRAQIDAITEALADATPGSAPDLGQARVLVEPMFHTGQLTPAAVHRFAAERRLEPLVVALALLCGMPDDLMLQLFRTNRGEMRLVPCRAIDLPWPTVAEIQRTAAGGSAISQADLDRQFGLYAGLTRLNAQTLLRFWLVQGCAKNPQSTPAARPRNRRDSIRRVVNLPGALLAPTGTFLARCTVLDLSNGGARVTLVEPVEVPDRVVLLLGGRAGGGVRRTGEIRWRSRSQLGVRFEAGPA